jgi:hypothetical protein
MKPIAAKGRTFSTVSLSRKQPTAFRLRVWCAFSVLALLCANVWSGVYHIDSVRIDAPRINNDSLVYTMDIHFHERPGPFWSYYDPETGSVIIEFIDAEVLAPEVRIAKGLPFMGFKVRKTESEMALTKVVSRATVGLDRGPGGEQLWNNDVRLLGESALRLIIWKEKADPGKKVGHKKSHGIAISVGISVLLLCAVIAYFTL